MATRIAIEQLRSPVIWAPTGVLILATQIYAVRTDRSGVTDLYRRAASCPHLRWLLFGWLAITGAHFHRIGPRSLDPYGLLSHLLERR